MIKNLFLIRHGLSLHNQKFKEMNYDVNAFRIPEVIDSPLIEEGQIQSIELGKKWKDKGSIELVLVSPLLRTLETVQNIFGDTDKKIICLEILREYPIGRDTCNMRSDISDLKIKFPNIDFSNIKENKDIYWKKEERDMETMEELNNRLEDLKKYLIEQKENNIAIVSHASLIGKFKDNHISLIENGDEELKYCYPYEFKL